MVDLIREKKLEMDRTLKLCGSDRVRLGCGETRGFRDAATTGLRAVVQMGGD